MNLTHTTPDHPFEDLHDIYLKAAAVLAAFETEDSTIPVAVEQSETCRICFADAILHLVELRPHCGTIEDTIAESLNCHAYDVEHGGVPSTQRATAPA